MTIKNEKGIALVLALFTFVILMGFSAAFVIRTVNDNKASTAQNETARAFYIAEAGANEALDSLDYVINTLLRNEINSKNPQTIATKAANYVATQNAIGFIIEFALDESDIPQFVLDGTNAIYSPVAANFNSGTFDYDIIVSQKGNPVQVTAEIWDFSYQYKLQSSGSYKNHTREVLFSGDFTIRVQKDNFAKYALFTNNQSMPNGTQVWFKNTTNFSGPVQTNGRFNFYGNPGGIFDGAVTQHEQQARFYNNGANILLNDDNNGTIDVPVFNDSFTRGAPSVALSSAVQKQDLVTQAKGGQTFSGNGIFIANNGASLTGGIYVNGNCNVSMSVNGSNNAVYTITQGTTTKIVTVDRANNQTSVQTLGVGTVTYTGAPDGQDDLGTIIHVDGRVSSFAGTVQEDTKLTLSSNYDVVITNNVMYSDYTPAVGNPGDVSYVPPSAEGTENMLGIVSWGEDSDNDNVLDPGEDTNGDGSLTPGNVRIDDDAPNNINVHGSILARNGVFTVDDYDNYVVKGTATLLGGVISDNYGAFGLFNGSTGQQVSGYGRNFVYDERTNQGKAPPYFPSMSTFIAFTDDITDKIVWQEGGF